MIGKENDLMWDIPSESKHYKDRLGDHFFIIGRKNYEGSLETINKEKALVLTRNHAYDAEAKVFNDVDRAIAYAQAQGEEELFVLGGEQIYELMMPKIDLLYLSTIDFQEKGDSYFPRHEGHDWSVLEEFSHCKDEQTPYSWAFKKLIKK